jgi:putative mRNA 3-end processing factor
VANAVITHAHSDHSRAGSAQYYATHAGLPIMKHRLGVETQIQGLAYGEVVQLGRAQISLHPAGHILGSAQVRVECDGEVWVVSGDYKRNPDPTCEPFEVVPCDVFITEATFGSPIYRWEEGPEIGAKIFAWWEQNAAGDQPSVLLCYSLGKAQRVLAELLAYTDKTVYLHGAVESLTKIYREQGIAMLPTRPVSEMDKSYSFAKDLILAPPSAHRSSWMKRFKNLDTAFASGWMQVRGARRRRGYDKGFVLSDHADWFDLVRTARETRAKKVLVTHGNSDVLSRYLTEIGIPAEPLETHFGEDDGE